MRVTLAALYLAVSVSACGGPTPVSNAGVSLNEGAIGIDAAAWREGPVTLDITNVGNWAHTLVVTADDGSVVAATDLLAPGTTATLAFDVSRGGYEISCRLVGIDDQGNVIDHYQLGMRAEIEVAAG